jgi:hypothetical protein
LRRESHDSLVRMSCFVDLPGKWRHHLPV